MLGESYLFVVAVVVVSRKKKKKDLHQLQNNPIQLIQLVESNPGLHWFYITLLSRAYILNQSG